MSEAILQINNLPNSLERDYSNCNNFLCPLKLSYILTNIYKLLGESIYSNIKVKGSEITFDIASSDNIISGKINIYKSTSDSNKHLIAVELSKPVQNFGRFYNKLKNKILTRTI